MRMRWMPSELSLRVDDYFGVRMGDIFNQRIHQTSNDIRLRMLGRKEERREQTQLSRNEDVEIGKREDQVGPHPK